jgi:cytosine/uracil/thiamine/allantoin permease
VLGMLFAGVVLAVVASYVCTELLLSRLHARRRAMVGEDSALPTIVLANLVSFLVLWVSAAVFIFASDTQYYIEALAICALAQLPWLIQHLWLYRRDHLRLRYEN